jgi:alpha-ketoglutarate-dependent taurine dioxygenase
MTSTAARMTEPLTITPLSGSIGAQVEGADLRRDIPPAVAQQIREAFATHFVLVFRNEHTATPEEQHRLAALFGEPQPLALFQFLGARQPSITFNPGSRIAASDRASAPKPTASVSSEELRNLGIAGDFDGWHSDSTFTPWLPRAAVLRAEVIPPVGGDTGFASLCAAYDALSPMMRDWLAEASAVHIVPAGFKEGINLVEYGPDAEARFDAEYPPREWPLVIAHPETGRKALFVNPGYIVHIRGLKRPESHALIRFLCRHVASLNFVYRHHWRAGDLVLWDELTALHRAPDDFAPHDRKVVRVTAGRVVPTAPKRGRAEITAASAADAFRRGRE